MVLLFVLFVATSFAVDDEDVSSSSSLLMMKSSKQRVKLHTGEEDDQSLSGMSSLVETLAEKVAGHNYTLSESENQALQTIKDFIEKLHLSIDTQHAEDQAELWRINYAIGNCSTDAAAALAGPVTDFDGKMQTKRGTHATCRTAEGTQKMKMDLACSEYDSYRKTNSQRTPPDCVKTVSEIVGTSDAIKRTRLGNCLEETKVWFDPLYARYLDCKGNRTDHNGERKACNKAQTTFEKAFCSYKIKLGDTCDEQDRCHQRNIKLRDATHKDVQASEVARKAEYKTGSHVLCFFRVFESSNEDKSKILAECRKAKIDTTKYDMVYPGIPDPNVCERKATSPCDEYTGAAWHVNAPNDDCGPCV